MENHERDAVTDLGVFVIAMARAGRLIKWECQRIYPPESRRSNNERWTCLVMKQIWIELVKAVHNITYVPAPYCATEDMFPEITRLTSVICSL